MYSKTLLLRYFSLDKEKFKPFMYICIPAMIEYFMASLFSMVDMAMVGNYDTLSIGAIGLTNTPINILQIAIFGAASAGITTVVAWNIGSKNVKGAVNTLKIGFLLNISVSVVITIFGLFFAPQIIGFMAGGTCGNPFDSASVAGKGVEYFKIIIYSTVFQSLSLCITSAMRGAGETKIPLIYNSIANLLNVLGNYVFIFGKFGFEPMGIKGAALSTTLSKLIALLFAIIYLVFSKNSVLALSTGYWKEKINFSEAKTILKVGLPSAGENLAAQAGFLLYARLVASLGPVILTSHNIAINIANILCNSFMALNVASTSLVGQCIGGGDKEEAKKYTFEIQKISAYLGIIGGFLLYFFAENIAHFYTPDADIIKTSVGALRFYSFTIIAVTMQFSTSGSLRGAGDTKYPLYVSLFSVLILRVAITYVFIKIFHMSLAGAWLSMFIDQALRAVLYMKRWKSGKWENMRENIENN